jgi:hypothetical protein
MAGPRKGASSVEVYGFVGWIASFVASGERQVAGTQTVPVDAVTLLQQQMPAKSATKCSC